MQNRLCQDCQKDANCKRPFTRFLLRQSTCKLQHFAGVGQLAKCWACLLLGPCAAAVHTVSDALSARWLPRSAGSSWQAVCALLQAGKLSLSGTMQLWSGTWGSAIW